MVAAKDKKNIAAKEENYNDDEDIFVGDGKEEVAEPIEEKGEEANPVEVEEPLVEE